MNQKISIKDIAQMAGVSVATVSRVLNHKGRYSQKTEEKIRKIVKEYGYTSNMAAKALRSSTSHMIGLLIPDITNEFFARIAYFCEEELFDQGYSLMLCNTNNEPQKEARYINDLVAKNAGGILAISNLTDLPKSFTNNPLPLVVIDRVPANHAHTPYVMTSEISCAYKLTKYMIDHGSMHIIGLLPYDLNEGFTRVNGFLACLKETGMLKDIQHQLYNFKVSANSLNEAYTLMDSLLNQGQVIDGVFCGSDRIALGASQAIKKHDLKIPEDVQIVGFDNSLYAKLADPPITTIKRESEKLSQLACTMLLKLINNPQETVDSIVLPSEIILRQSTR